MRQGFNLWMITILFASVIVISATTPPDPVVHWKQHFSNRDARGTIETYSTAKHNISDRASEFPSSRFRRNPNDDAFSTLQSRISSLARIVSGVTLYNGVVDGSIPVDEAISELMNIGSFSLDDLMKFEEKKANGFAGQLKVASTKMSDNSIEIETAIMDYLKMKEMWNEVGDFKNLPDISKFEELKSMNSLDLKSIEEFKLADAEQKINGNSVADIPIIKADLGKLADASENALKSMEEKHIFTTLADMSSFHEYVNLVVFVDSSKPYRKLETRMTVAMKADIDTLQGIVNDETSIFRIMSGIASSQSGVHHFDRKHTSGFVNGYADLKHLPKDSNDSWLRENFKWLELKDGLTTISNLEAKMKHLSGNWNVLGNGHIRKSVRNAEFIGKKLKGISGVSNLVHDLIPELEKYPEPIFNSAYSADISKMSQHLFELLKKGLAIREISALLKQKKNVISVMDASNPASIQAIIGLLQTLKTPIDLLQTGKKVNELAELLVKRPTDYSDIKTSSSSISCQNFLNALKNQKGDSLEKVATAAELAIRLRELKTDTDFSTNIKIASSIVSASSDFIKEIQTSIRDIKKSSADNTQTFSQLKNLQKFSKPLGDSSAVIDKIKKVLEKEKQLTNFVNNGDIVMQLAGSQKIMITGEIKELAKKLWYGYYDVSQKSKILLDEVKKKKDGVTKPTDDKLESYGPIIGGLDGLGDVILNADERIMAIGILQPSITDRDTNLKLESIKNSLAELGSLDLTFTRQSSSLKGMSQVLAGINDVFLGTKPTNTVDPKTGENVCGAQFSHVDSNEGNEDLDNGDEPPQYNDTSTKEKSGNDVVYWICIGMLCTVVGGCIITFVVWVVKINIQAYRRQKRYKEEHKEEIAKARRMSDYIAGRVRSPGRRSYPVSKAPLSEDQ